MSLQTLRIHTENISFTYMGVTLLGNPCSRSGSQSLPCLSIWSTCRCRVGMEVCGGANY